MRGAEGGRLREPGSRPTLIAAAALVILAGARCGSGSGGKGERFGAPSNATSPIATQGPTTTTRAATSAVSGSYDIEITLTTGGADKCRDAGTLHETVAVQEQAGDRPLTVTNDVPDANGQKQVENGVLHDDGSWDATGTYTSASGSAAYAWHGSFPGDGTTSGTYTGTTSSVTCSWRFTGRHT
jgi:hypothetical protein